jgi:hypothetical protein
VNDTDALLAEHQRQAPPRPGKGPQALPDHQRYQRVGISLTPAQIDRLQQLLAEVGDRHVSMSDLVRLALTDLFRGLDSLEGPLRMTRLRAELHDLYQDEVAAYPGRKARGQPRPR